MSERHAGFTPGERAAIAAYLEYKAQAEESPRAKIEQALRNYWLHPPQ